MKAPFWLISEYLAMKSNTTATCMRGELRRRLNTIRPHASIGYATSTRGVRACIRRVSGCATPTSSAGHSSAIANLKLAFHLGHSATADQSETAPESGAFFNYERIGAK